MESSSVGGDGNIEILSQVFIKYTDGTTDTLEFGDGMWDDDGQSYEYFFQNKKISSIEYSLTYSGAEATSCYVQFEICGSSKSNYEFVRVY